MAASITNSNKTLGSITAGLLIHEVDFSAPSPLRDLALLVLFFPILLDSCYISYPHPFTPLSSFAIFEAEEHHSIWESFLSITWPAS